MQVGWGVKKSCGTIATRGKHSGALVSQNYNTDPDKFGDFSKVVEWSHLSRRIKNFRLILHDDPQLWEPPRQLDRCTTHPGADINDGSRFSMLRPIVVVDQSSM